MTRRQMIRNTTLLMGCTCTCVSFASTIKKSDCCNTPDLELESYVIKDDRILIDLTKTKVLQSGHAAFISNPEKNIEMIIIRPDLEKFVALSRLCTHGRQILSYNQHRRLLQCNSYNHSLFELDGQVYKGPAPKALDVYKVVKAQETITVYL